MLTLKNVTLYLIIASVRCRAPGRLSVKPALQNQNILIFVYLSFAILEDLLISVIDTAQPMDTITIETDQTQPYTFLSAFSLSIILTKNEAHPRSSDQ